MTSTQRKKAPSWAILEVTGLTLVALAIAILGGAIFLVPLIVMGYDIEATMVLVGATAAGQVGFLLVASVYVRRRSVRVPVSVPSRRDLAYVGGGIVFALLAAIGLSQLLVRFDLVPGSVIEDIATIDPTFLLALAVLSVVLVAPAEELLFRGAIQGRLREVFGPGWAVVGASLLFGALHLANYTGALLPVVAGALLIAVIGAILGALYERTGNLAVPIIVHAVYNVVLLTISYVAIVYG